MQKLESDVPIELIDYLTESFKEAANVYGKVKKVSCYGGSAFVIFEDSNKTYRLNFQSYKSEVCMDEIVNPRCNLCGGKQTLIRGRYPKTESRLICPTCSYERLEQINDIKP